MGVPEAPRQPTPPVDQIFASGPPERGGIPILAWVIAGAVVLAVAAGLVLTHARQKPSVGNGPQPLDPYAQSLAMSQLAMSESESLSGGKSTFIDGHVKNTGEKTINGITVQVLFQNGEGMPPAVETLPLTLVRTREPYVDTQPVSAVPLKPGDEREFRLIFETIPTNWNQQMPEIRPIRVGSH